MRKMPDEARRLARLTQADIDAVHEALRKARDDMEQYRKDSRVTREKMQQRITI